MNSSANCSTSSGCNSNTNEAPPSPSLLTPTEPGGKTICRRIQFLIPKDLPALSEQAVDPDFFKASHMVQELSCSSNGSNKLNMELGGIKRL